jgi:hypothetical protein
LKFSLLLILLTFNIFSQELNFTPIIKSEYNNQGGLLISSITPTIISGWGGKFQYNNENIEIYSELINYRYFGKNTQISNLNPDLGIGYYGRRRQSGFDFSQINFKISYNLSPIILEFGKYNQNWGPSTSSLIISNKAPSYPQFGFNWGIGSNYSFEYFHGKLNSLIPDSLTLNYYNYTDELNTPGIPFIEKYIVAHRLNWKITDNLLIGASESVIYGGRGVDINYLIPFSSFWAIQNYIGSYDNVQMCLDLSYDIKNKYQIFGMLFIDELKPSQILKRDNNNWLAFQFGINIKNLIKNYDKLLIEFTWTDHRVYNHKFELNNFYSYGFPLGFWAGPHATFLQFNYNFKISKYLVIINYNQIRKGGLTTQMLEDQYNTIYYERFKDTVEDRKSFKVELNKTIYNYFDIKIGVLFVDWRNAGFIPILDNNNSNLDSIIKYNYFIGFEFDKYLFKI